LHLLFGDFARAHCVRTVAGREVGED
jgi:hypothetical protein